MTNYVARSPRRRWSKILMIVLVFIIAITVSAIALVRQNYNNNLKPVSANQKSVVIIIPPGTSAREIALLLKKEGLIRSNWAFEAYVKTKNLREDLQAGTYALRPSQSVQEIVEVLTQGHIATDLITILPGKRLEEIRDALINEGLSPSAVDEALKPEQYINHPSLVDKPAGATLEGYLYPESFQRTTQTTPADIVRASLDQMQLYLTPDVRAGFVRQGLTVHQGVTLASIVEQEVGHTDPLQDREDKKKVAQVFLKRLKEDKPLESDATAGYGAIAAGQTPSLSFISPYNTYLNKGLPPGPISNVGQAALNAVADPAPTDFLYFVSGDPDSNGVSTTYFSRTLEEHEALVKAHCKKLCR